MRYLRKHKKVIISKRNDKNEIVKYYFNANAWFDSKKDDKAIVREFLAQDENGNTISKLSYGFQIVCKLAAIASFLQTTITYFGASLTTRFGQSSDSLILFFQG